MSGTTYILRPSGVGAGAEAEAGVGAELERKALGLCVCCFAGCIPSGVVERCLASSARLGNDGDCSAHIRTGLAVRELWQSSPRRVADSGISSTPRHSNTSTSLGPHNRAHLHLLLCWLGRPCGTPAL